MKLDRREFVKLSAFAFGSAALRTDLSWAFPRKTEPRQASGKRVIILGAGLAGLAAGWELRDAGHEVTILEAQLHPGGRVRTIREGLSDDLYAEAGAGRIPANHDVTQEWIKYFGLELEPFSPKDLAKIALLKGKRVKLPADMSLVPLNLTAEERRVGLEGMDKYYYGETARIIGNHIREDWPPEIARLADISAHDLLRQRGASEDAIHYMLLGFEDNSALDYIKDIYNHESFLWKIKGGNDLLPRAFAEKLSAMIRYGCAVERIDRGRVPMQITYRRMGSLENLDADAVVCTIPVYGPTANRCDA